MTKTNMLKYASLAVYKVSWFKKGKLLHWTLSVQLFQNI